LQDEKAENAPTASPQASGPGQRLATDPEQRLGHDHDHGGLDAQKQRLGQRHAPIDRVERREGQDHQRAGNDEKKPADQAARHAGHAPSGIGGQLHRLRPRQQHAEAERLQVLLFGEPVAVLDQFLVHQRDLRRRAAEGQEADAPEDADQVGDPGGGEPPGLARVCHVPSVPRTVARQYGAPHGALPMKLP
jgi:hypothetical protein